MWKSLLLSFGITFVLSLGALKFFPKLGLMDRPHLYGHKREPIPYPAGLSLVFGVLAALAFSLPWEPYLIAVMAGGLLLALTAFLDDRLNLSPYLRLGVQFVSAAILVWGGVGLVALSSPLGGSFSLLEYPWLARGILVFWVMVMVNAFNWLDGVPGMSSSIAAISAATLLLLSLRPDFHFYDQSASIALSSAVLGGSLAFALFDVPKPRMLMGDTGSMFLGFMLAVTAVISGAKLATAALVLGFPLLDFVWVIVRRIFEGKSPFSGDLWHFHHRLLKAGFGPRQVVCFFSVCALIFGVAAILLSTLTKFIVLGCILLFMLLLAVLYLERSR